jgi:polyisoprenoid-binding protein YceI
MMKTALCLAVLAAFGTASAAPVTYQIDPNHTSPSFEADHLGGLSIWRGKFTKSEGTVVLDKEAGTGTLDITVQMSSILFGNEKLDEDARGPKMFDAEKFPTAQYKGKLAGFKNGAPTEAQGELTLHGVTKPVTLKINQFLCKKHPMSGKEVCGADASATIDRSAFGVDFGKAYGFRQDVKLLISVEAVRAD